MGDDGEKFGAWPTTWDHCWGGDRWVDRFLDALEANADWLTTTTPSAWLEHEPPIGRVYLPTGSYAEMGEWSLPAEEGRRSRRCSTRTSPRAGRSRAGCAAASGATSRSSTARSTTCTSRCCGPRPRSRRCPEGPVRERATDHLFQGQSNDCYWHGVFGGIYLSHMRLATLEHLIAAQDAADRAGRDQGLPVDGIRSIDADLDGVAELVVTSDGQSVVIKPSEGAGIGTWDIRAPRHALASVLRRRPEAYHAKLVAFEAGGGAGPRGCGRCRGIHPRHRQGARARACGATALRPARAAVGPGPHPGRGRHGRVVRRHLCAVSWVTSWKVPSRSVTRRPTRSAGRAAAASRPMPASRRWPSTRRSGSTGIGGRRASRWRSGRTTRATRPSTRASPSAGRSRCWAAAATPPRGTTSGERRVGFDTAGELSGATSIAFGNDAVGVSVDGGRLSTARTSGGRPSIPCPSPRTASSGPTRAAASPSCGRSSWRPASRQRGRYRWRSPRPWTVRNEKGSRCASSRRPSQGKQVEATGQFDHPRARSRGEPGQWMSSGIRGDDPTRLEHHLGGEDAGQPVLVADDGQQPFEAGNGRVTIACMPRVPVSTRASGHVAPGIVPVAPASRSGIGSGPPDRPRALLRYCHRPG